MEATLQLLSLSVVERRSAVLFSLDTLLALGACAASPAYDCHLS